MIIGCWPKTPYSMGSRSQEIGNHISDQRFRHAVDISMYVYFTHGKPEAGRTRARYTRYTRDSDEREVGRGGDRRTGPRPRLTPDCPLTCIHYQQDTASQHLGRGLSPQSYVCYAGTFLGRRLLEATLGPVPTPSQIMFPKQVPSVRESFLWVGYHSLRHPLLKLF